MILTAFVLSLASRQGSSTWGPDKAPEGVHLELAVQSNPKISANFVAKFVNESSAAPLVIHDTLIGDHYKFELLDASKKEPPLTKKGYRRGINRIGPLADQDLATEIFPGETLRKDLYIDLSRIYQIQPNTTYLMRLFYYDNQSSPVRLTSNQILIKT